MLKCRGYLRQKLTDLQMLRTYTFAFPAFDALRSFAVSISRNDVAVIVACVPVVKGFMGIQGREQVRDADTLRTFTLFDAVTAGSTGNQVKLFENITDLMDKMKLYKKSEVSAQNTNSTNDDID